MQEYFSQTGCAFPIFSLALPIQLCCVWDPQSTCLLARPSQQPALGALRACSPPPTEHFHLSKRCLSAIHNAEEPASHHSSATGLEDIHLDKENRCAKFQNVLKAEHCRSLIHCTVMETERSTQRHFQLPKACHNMYRAVTASQRFTSRAQN